MSKAEKAVAVKKEQTTALAPLQMDFEMDAGAGFENADKDAFAIPFLSILQSGSPQCKKSDGAYIKGAEEGMLHETVSGTVYPGDAGLSVVPCYFRRAFVEWRDREGGGGGFVAEHDAARGAELLRTTTKNEKGQDTLPSGNYLVDTRYHYVLMITPDGNYKPALMTMTSTQMKKSRRWMTVMDAVKMSRGDGSKFTPPMFSHQYHVTTIPESNDKGSWMGWKIELEKMVGDANLYAAAKSFRDAISKGAVKVTQPEAVAQTEAEEF